MTWVKIDDGMIDHPKIIGISDRALRLYLFGLCYSSRHLTDGFVPEQIARQFGRKFPAELVKAGLWDDADSGYKVHDYGEYQPTAAAVKEQRNHTKQRVSAWREKQARKTPRNAPRNAVTNSVRNAVSNAPPVPDPIPSIDEHPEGCPSPRTPKPRPRNEQWDALEAVFGYRPKGSEAALWGRLVVQLREFGATVETVEEAARRYRADMPTVSFTPSGLVKNYQRLIAAPITRRANGSKADLTLELARQARKREESDAGV